MRVMSRKPPAASRSSVRVLVARRRSRRPSASTPRAAARGSRARRARRDASGVTVDDLGAEVAHHAQHRACTRARRCRAVGVSTQVAPTNRSASAPSTPSCSEPAIGWPPTKRADASRARRARPRRRPAPFTEPTSVTTGAPASSAATTASAIAPTGTATNTRSAPRTASSSVGARSRRPRRAACARASRVVVAVEADDVVARARASASPTEPPMRPGADDRDPAGHGQSGRSSRSDARAFEVHVMELVARLLAVEVHQHPDRARHAVRDRRAPGRRAAARRRGRAPGPRWPGTRR